MAQNQPEDVATEIATRRPPAGPIQLSSNFQRITDEGAWALAERIKSSTIIPKDFINKPDNIFIAILMGREVGLSPMQAVQNIMVVNGRPSMWGDSLPALVYASGKCEKFEEEHDEKSNTAICTVRRTGDTKDHVQKFSWADAIKAGYDKKPGPWQSNPRRMMQMRARAFALRDKFADVLKGLGMVEEAQDYEILNGSVSSSINMPREVVDVPTKAAAFNAQEATVAAEPTPQPDATDSPAEDPRISNAKAKFKSEFGVEAGTIDGYLAWHKLKTFGEVYPRLQTLWKEIKAGKSNVAAEFDRFKQASEAAPAQVDDNDMFH